MEKLKRVHVIGGAIGIAVLLTAAVYFGLIKNLNLEIETTTNSITTAMGSIETGATADSDVEEVYQRAKKKADQELVEAQRDLVVTLAQYEDFKQRYRRITFNTDKGTYQDVFPQLVSEYRDLLIPEFTRFVEAHECVLVQAPSIGEPPTPPINFPTSALFAIPDSSGAAAAAGFGGFGGSAAGGGGTGGPASVTVQGSYASVATLLKRLPTFSRLCLIGPVTFRNLDPVREQVEASFSIIFYLVADGPEAVVKAALSAAAAGSAPAGGDPNAAGGAVPGGDPNAAGGGMPAAPPAGS